MTDSNDDLTMPFNDDDRVREDMLRAHGIDERLLKQGAGDVLIKPRQMVDTLFQLIDGSIDLIRDFGTAKETRRTFTRSEAAMPGSTHWTPILGCNYFFLKKASSIHYVVTSPSKLLRITPQRIRKMYAARDCRKLVREMIRNSDAAPGYFDESLDEAWNTLYYVGFRKDQLATLLGGDETYVGLDTAERADQEAIRIEAYGKYANEMIFRLMGDMLTTDDGGTKLEFEAPRIL